MKGWLGQRTPTVSPPAVTIFGISLARGNTSVNGPGQKARASWSAKGGQALVQRLAIATLLTWTMMGFSAGRPLVSKILDTASASIALAAKPYTVSVGRAIISPARSASAALFTAVSNSAAVCVGKTSALSIRVPMLIHIAAHRLDR